MPTAPSHHSPDEHRHDHHDDPVGPLHEPSTRRSMLRDVGIGSVGLFGAMGFLSSATTLIGGAAPAVAAPTCTLTPEVTEGPYYLDLERIRKNITEGKAGIRLDLKLTIVDSSTCEPLENVAVDIWHADALGVYSGFQQEGTSGKTYLRGVQLTNAKGVATFRTIYPGWYQGRATHIHMKTYLGGKTSGSTYDGGHTAHTGQLFFQDTTTDKVAKLSPYTGHDITRQRNTSDNIYSQAGGKGAILKLTRRSSSIKSGYVGTITVGIDQDATGN